MAETDRHTRAKNIVLGAESLPEELRTPFVDRVCAGDPDLRAEVDALREHRHAPPPGPEPEALDSLLDTALREEAPEPATADPHQEQIGPYRILEVLGEGATGIVYRAEQTQPIRREVAVKLLRGDHEVTRVMARLEAERQDLALTNHPHIARILDAGADARGRPYFVMELVAGPPITEYCDRRALSSRDRVDLFVSVCDAVQHAHQRGVLHRNLKPSNVLVPEVDGKPFPMVTDFGVAKALGDPLTAEGMAMLDGMLLGTPEYMSPEQAGSGAASVDARSDVYALGVLLFEMLTGRRPYRLSGLPLSEIPLAILEQEPGRPLGGGDLDAIVLLAMRKEPSLRYASVAHLAEDLRRHIAGRPVGARRGSWRYRMGKFLVRNAVPLGLAAAAFVWLGGFTITLATRSARVGQERDRARAAESAARREAEAAKSVSGFLAGLFDGTSPKGPRGETITSREALDRGLTRIRTEYSGEPELQGRLLATVGTMYDGLGLDSLAGSVLQEALALQERTVGPFHVDVAATLDRLGAVAHDQGSDEGSLEYYQRALAIRTAVLGDTAAEVAESYRHVAIAHQTLGRLEHAESFLRGALARNRRLHGDEHVEVASDKYLLAGLLTRRGRYVEAEPLVRDALATQRRLLGDRNVAVAGTMDQLAGVRWRLGAYAEAESLWRRTRDIYRALAPEGNAAVAQADDNVARALASRGNLKEAEAYSRSGLDIVRRVLGPRDASYAVHLRGLGHVLTLEGRLAEAEPLLRHSLAMCRRIYGDQDANVAMGLEAMGDLELRRGRVWAANGYFREALTIREATLPPGHPDRALPLLGLAQAALDGGDAATATPLAIRAVALRAASLGASNPLTVEAQEVLDRCGPTAASGG